MPNLSIKDVPEAWARALRARAQRHHRSLQGELMALLEQALSDAPALSDHTLPLQKTPAATQDRKSIEQLAQIIRERHPGGLPSGPSSIALVREDRDAR